MKVRVRLHGALRRFLPAGLGEAEVDLPPGATAADAAAVAGVPDGQGGLFARDGRQIEAGDPLEEGCLLEVFPPLAGGRGRTRPGAAPPS